MMELIVQRQYVPESGEKYSFPYRATLTLSLNDEEAQLVKNYGLESHVLTQGRLRSTTVGDVINGTRDAVENLDVLIANEDALLSACQTLQSMLDYCRSFGSQVTVPIS